MVVTKILKDHYEDLHSFLDTLEVKEVDLEKELESWRHNHFHGRRDKDASGEYLERVSQLNLAEYFFELGMAVSNKQIEEKDMKTGIELIAEERQRQIKVEGWTKEHDAQHKNDELVKAAICYADSNIYYHQENRFMRHRIPNEFWPTQWDIHWFKPTDRIRDLVKAGALIAAEIDRLQAQKGE